MTLAHVYTVAFEGIAALGSKHTYEGKLSAISL